MNKLSILTSVASIYASFAIMQDADARFYPYVGLSLGQSSYDDVCNSSTPPITSCEDTDITYKVYAGAKFNRNIAGEVSYRELGEAEVNTDKISAKGLSASAFGIYPASYNLDLFVKIGGIYWDAERTGEMPATSTGADLLYGLGMNYGINSSLAVRAEYENILRVGGEITSGESPLTQITLGASWYF